MPEQQINKDNRQDIDTFLTRVAMEILEKHYPKEATDTSTQNETKGSTYRSPRNIERSQRS